MKYSVNNSPDQHGFVLMGSDVLFINHFTMFYKQNHMYQLILEISIPDSAKAQYLADQKQHPDSMYALGNLSSDLFTIPSIAIGKRKAFQGDIFRGVPEDPNTDKPLVQNIKVEIRRIIRLRHFDFDMNYNNKLTYVLFGSEQEAFLSQKLIKQPDFMDVLQLKHPPKWLQLEQLSMGVDINFAALPFHPGDTPCVSPLDKSTQYQVEYQGQKETSFNVEILKNIFFSTAIPNSVDPCN